MAFRWAQAGGRVGVRKEGFTLDLAAPETYCAAMRLIPAVGESTT